MLEPNQESSLGGAESLRQGLPSHLLAVVGAGSGPALHHTPAEAWAAYFESATSAAVVLDPRGIIIAQNAAWKTTFGPGAAKAGVGTSYVMECQADDASLGPEVPRAIAGVRSVLERARDGFQWEYHCHTGSEERWFTLRVTAVQVAGERFVVVAHEDVSSRYRAEMARRHAQQRFELLMAAAEFGLWEWDLSNNAVYYSPQFKSLLGYGPDEFGERLETLQSHLHPDDRKATITTLFEHLEGQGSCRCDCRLRTQDGSHRAFRLYATAIRDAGGTPVCVAGSLHAQCDVAGPSGDDSTRSA